MSKGRRVTGAFCVFWGWGLGGTFRQRLCGPFRIHGDHLQIGAGRGIGLGATLFPVAQGAERDLVAGGKRFLGQTQGPADDLDLGHARRGAELIRRQGRVVGVGERFGFRFRVGHGVEAGPVAILRIVT